jgi:hypothetical protein
VLTVSNEVKSAPGLAIIVDDVPVPDTQLNGEVFRPTATHEIVVRATGRKDVRLIAVPNRQAVVTTLGMVVADATPPPPPPLETSSGGWGWQKWTGVGMMAVGAGGIAYSVISFLGYKSDESSLSDTRRTNAKDCTGTPLHVDSCMNDLAGTRVRAANDAIAAYDAKERSATSAEPIWIIAGSAGVVLIGAGVVLFATAPSRTNELPPPAAGATHWQVVPRVGLHDSGLGVVGTF